MKEGSRQCQGSGKPNGGRQLGPSPPLPPGSWVASGWLPHHLLLSFANFMKENMSPDQVWPQHLARGNQASSAIYRARERISRTHRRHPFIHPPAFPLHTWPTLKGSEPRCLALSALSETNPTAGQAWQRSVPCFTEQKEPDLNPTSPKAQIWTEPRHCAGP